jgi:type VI secretion system protein ImpH
MTATPAELLFRTPYAFDFFQAVRLLEALHPDRRPVGREGPPDAEAVHLMAHPSLAFPASQIAALDADAAGGPPRMAVTFLGLSGPTGVLPPFYTQAVIARDTSGGDAERGALQAWLDLFTHRFASLFHRAWAKYRLPISYEQAARSGGRSGPIAEVALSLIGLGTPGLKGRLRAGPVLVDDLALVRYAGLLVAAARPAVGLETLLADYFGVPVRVEQFRGRWLTLDLENQSRLGRRGQNDNVGVSLLAGRRVWDAQGCFRVRVGPLDGASFAAFLPDPAAPGRRLAILAQLVRFYERDTLDFEVQLLLKADAVPPLQLARGGPGSRLGWNTWLGRRGKDVGDAGDTVFRRDALLSA